LAKICLVESLHLPCMETSVYLPAITRFIQSCLTGILEFFDLVPALLNAELHFNWISVSLNLDFLFLDHHECSADLGRHKEPDVIGFIAASLPGMNLPQLCNDATCRHGSNRFFSAIPRSHASPLHMGSSFSPGIVRGI